MSLFRSRYFVGVFLSLFLFVGLANAFLPLLIPLAATVARAAIPVFASRSVVSVAGGVASIAGTGSKVLKFATTDTRVAGLVLLAGFMGYSDSFQSTPSSTYRYGSAAPASSDAAALANFIAAYPPDRGYARGATYQVTGSGTSSVNTMFYITGVNSAGVVSNVFGLNGIQTTVTSSQSVLASDAMVSDLINSPTQQLTDQVVSGLSNVAVSSPSAFDSLVKIVAAPSSQVPSDYSSGDSISVSRSGSNVVINGVPYSGVGTFTGKDGLTHYMTIGANGSLLVDGVSSNGFTASVVSSTTSVTTSPAGVLSTSQGTVDNSGVIAGQRAIVDSVNKSSSANTSSLATLKTAIDNSSIKYGTATPNAPMSTNKTYDFSTFGLAPLSLTNASGVCPAAPTVVLKGQTVSIDNTPLCTFFDWVRPALLALGWFSAIMVFVGTVRNN